MNKFIFFTYAFRTFAKRGVELFWMNETAIFISKRNITIYKQGFERYTKGLIQIEVPLTTRHVASMDYEYTVIIILC